MEPRVTLFDSRLLSLIENCQNIEEVKSSIAKDNLFNTVSSANNTLLHIAATNGNVAIVKYLIDSGSNVDSQNVLGQTPLMLAIMNDRGQKVIGDLINSGANLYLLEGLGKNALQMIGQCDWLTDKIRRLVIEKIRSECSNDQEKFAMKLYDADWPLIKIIQLKDAGLTRIMLQNGYNVDAAASHSHETALHLAVKSLDVENVKVLLEYNANVRAEDAYHRTPLSYVYDARRTGHSREKIDILKMLLAHTRSQSRETPQVRNLLQYGNDEAVKLLLQSGINIPLVDPIFIRNSAVHILARNKNPGAIEQLRDWIFHVDARNFWGETALMVAAKEGIANAIVFLLNRGAAIDATNREGHTALFLTVYNFGKEELYKECVQVLLERGAKVQLEIGEREESTIFGAILRERKFLLGEIVIAHLVLQEARGNSIGQLICRQIKSRYRFRSFFVLCKQQLETKVYKSTTLLDMLIDSDKKMERYVSNNVMMSELKTFGNNTLSNNYYFGTLLQKRLSKATCIVKLKRRSAHVICKIMQTDYDRFPFIADNIVNYLQLRDMKNLIDTLA